MSLLTVAGVGCAAQDGPLPEPEQGAIAGAASPEVGVTEQALDSTWVAGPYRVSGNQSVAMNGGTHFCVLTRVAGSFQGWGETVAITANSVQWILASEAMQPGVSAEAHCFVVNKFQANTSRRDWTFGNPASHSSDSGCSESKRNTLTGDYTTFITGMSGKWEGGCEFAHLTQSGSLSTLGSIRVGSGQPGDLGAVVQWAEFAAGPESPSTGPTAARRPSNRGRPAAPAAS